MFSDTFGGRSSLGFDFSQGEFGSVESETSQPATQGSRNAQQRLDPPYVAATCAGLLRDLQAEDALGPYGKTCANVSVVGWVVGKAEIRQGESEFKLSDGTGEVLVQVDVPSNREEWLVKELKSLIGKEDGDEKKDESEESRGRFLTVVGNATYDENHQLNLRAVCIRPAFPQEAAYHHTLRVCVEILRMDGGNSATPVFTSSMTTKTPVKEREVTLPKSLDHITDECQINVLKAIMRARQPDIGITLQDLHKKAATGRWNLEAVKSAISELEEAGEVMRTIDDDHIDVTALE